MSGICSQHRRQEPGCRLCLLTPADVIPDWEAKVAEAKAAGEETCVGCGFRYYLTIQFCPLCGRHSKALRALCRRLMSTGLSDAAMALQAACGDAWALRRAAVVASDASVATRQLRDRTSRLDFGHHTLIGGLAAAQAEASDEARRMAQRMQPSSA